MPKREYYTQRDWDRVVGYGYVPQEYQYPHLRNTGEYSSPKMAKYTNKLLDKEDKS